MEIKIFGKQLFEVKKAQSVAIYNTAIDSIKKSDYLPDFYRDIGGSLDSPAYWSVPEMIGTVSSTVTNSIGGPVVLDATKPAEEKKEEISPKGVYQLKMLHDEAFELKTDPEYIEKQIAQFTDKLGMIKTSEFDMNRGTIEIASILTRFENRKKYPEFGAYYEEFPYTSSSKIAGLLKEHSHLKLGQVAQFLADMPQEAVDVMKSYTSQTKKLCGKKPIFYIIAKKKDFEKSEKRRDPILLAQSPFGHFWQILGAWDEEMILVDEL